MKEQGEKEARKECRREIYIITTEVRTICPNCRREWVEMVNFASNSIPVNVWFRLCDKCKEE